MTNILDTLPTQPSNPAKALTADESAVVVRELGELISGLGFLRDLVKQQSAFPEGVTHSILSLTESRNVVLAKMAGIELDSIQEREDRYARIRAANCRVRELETLLGAGASPAQTAAHLQVMSNRLNHWWDSYGFGHISDIRFTQYGHLEVTFSCHLFGDFRIVGSDTPISDKARRNQWLSSLRERGFVLFEVDGEREPSLLDCDANREALQTLFRATFARSRVSKFENYGTNDNVMVMRSLTVMFNDLDSVHRLPDEKAS